MQKNLFINILFFTSAVLLSAQENKETKPVFNQQKGIWEFKLDSEYQEGPAVVEVLVPGNLDKNKKYPVLYILPVGGPEKRAFGDGLEEARKADIHNKYGVICVCPYFTLVPWYRRVELP